MILRIATLFLSALISVTACLAAIEVPVSIDTPDDPGENHNKRHRSRPIDHWCTIDIENGSITSSVPEIISYELLDPNNNVTISEVNPSAFVAHFGMLSSGCYTLRLRTISHTYSGVVNYNNSTAD